MESTPGFPKADTFPALDHSVDKVSMKLARIVRKMRIVLGLDGGQFAAKSLCVNESGHVNVLKKKEWDIGRGRYDGPRRTLGKYESGSYMVEGMGG